jgi:hypothetical protein
VDLSAFGKEAPEVSEKVRAEGVLALGFPGPVMRLVTHRDVGADDIETALLVFRKVL